MIDLISKKTSREDLRKALGESLEAEHRLNVKLVQVSRERDLLAAENAQMSAALTQLAASADKDGTPGWWRVVAMRWQMEATRLRDAIAYALLQSSWGSDAIKLLRHAITLVDADKKSAEGIVHIKIGDTQ